VNSDQHYSPPFRCWRGLATRSWTSSCRQCHPDYSTALFAVVRSLLWQLDRSYGNYLYIIYIQFIRERNRLQENHQLYVNYNFFVSQSSSLPLRNSHTSWSLVFISKDIYLQHPCEPKNNIYNNRTLTEQYLI